MSTVDLAALRRRRGAIKASVTKLTTKLTELETKEFGPAIQAQAQQLSKRLENLDADFKMRHFAILDVLDDDDQLATEHDTLDNHDDEVADLSLRLQALLASTATTPLRSLSPVHDSRSPSSTYAVLERRSAQLQALDP